MSDNLFRSISGDNAYYHVTAKATYFPDFVIVYLPNSPFRMLKDDMERLTPYGPIEQEDKKEDKEADEESNAERSMRRTKKKVREYALCNKFDMFATFTFSTERQDIDRCRARMSDWLKNQQKRVGYFQYLIIPERHKKCVECVAEKKAACSHDEAIKPIHFHAFLMGYKGKIERATNPHTGKPLLKKRRAIYQFPSYRAGFTNVERIKDDPKSRSRIAMYVAKYITKDMPLFANKNRYWVSLRLKIPTIVYNPPAWYFEEKPEKVIEIKYGKLLIFPYKSKHDEYRNVIDLMERDEG